MYVDRIIIGAGLYGLYAAWLCGQRGERIIVLEYDAQPFMRATYINQARVHMGYHYPRSISTACKSACYFERFSKEFEDCILMDFKQIYATSASFSWTDARQFKKFCDDVGIVCEEISPNQFFKKRMCDGAFLTREYTYDAMLLKQKMLRLIEPYHNIEIKYNVRIRRIEQSGKVYVVEADRIPVMESPFVLNATYASVNQINQLAHFEPFRIKYELCEIILCDVGESLRGYGLTVMDGPFFSIMPFGKTGCHSLTSVTFTPHVACKDDYPSFDCQDLCGDGYCSPAQLGNCNNCTAKPKTAWPYMSALAKKYLRDTFEFQYRESLFSMKPILRASEIDDSRPTVIRKMSDTPHFISVLSGKINTMYDLAEVLNDGA